MDQLVPIIWDVVKCLGDCAGKHSAFVFDLEDNLQSLEEHWTQLQNRSQDVMLMIQHAESRPRLGRTREVDGWLQRVNDFEKTIEDIQEQGAKVVRDRCLGRFCHKNCVSSYNMGKDVVKNLDLVKELMDQGEKFDNSNISRELPRKLVEEMSLPKTVGKDLMLEKVWDSIGEENVGFIGLYGMGGVGKTTIMMKVYNEFARRQHDFAPVIWVVVSKNYNIDKIIDEICKSVHIDWKDKSRHEKAREIFNVMKHKKFVLFLDDMWEGLRLQDIGVPLPNETNQSKVLFTTRLKSVCHQMHAKMLKVECLEDKEALDLFCMKVGAETIYSKPTILELAQKLVRECKGLPLALITIGRAMAGRDSPESWEHAIKMLQSSPFKDKGMEEEVFFILKYSYDSLSNDIERKCFLDLGLFPDDESISIRDLILLWIGEGLLGEHDSIHDAFNHGHHLVESLKFACLVEDHEENSIKVHDMVRDMALWLLHVQDGSKNKILVQGEALKLLHGDNLENWQIVEKISINMDFQAYGTEMRMLNIPICPLLETLILKVNQKINKLENIQFMSQLKVLRLIRIEEITTLPTEIGQLIHLEYLELSWRSIEEKLPIDMKNLKQLKVLIIRDNYLSLGNISLDIISCLEELRVFEFILERASTKSEEELFLEQLELLPHLEDISITLVTPSGINKLFSSTKLQRCVRYVRASGGLGGIACHTQPIISSVKKLERLEHVEFDRLNVSWEESLVNHIDIFWKLSKVKICNCHSVTHLTWLMYAPVLRYLVVENCGLLEEVIMKNKDNGNQNMDGIFANLERILLLRLPNLRSIYKTALLFPKLKGIRIHLCPKLKKLPFDSSSAKYLGTIIGSSEWWNNLEWEDPTIRDLFYPLLKETDKHIRVAMHVQKAALQFIDWEKSA